MSTDSFPVNPLYVCSNCCYALVQKSAIYQLHPSLWDRYLCLIIMS